MSRYLYRLSAAAAGAFVASQVVDPPPAPSARGPSKPSRPEDVPGGPKSWRTSALEAGEVASQSMRRSFAPVNQIHQHVCGFHAYAHDFTRQVEAHHYCSHPTEDFRQCVIYDSDKPNARLIGIEYIISRPLFEALPEDEKKYWHSHQYEVLSGLLVAPGVPDWAERREMETLADSYGKTIHTWQYDRGDSLPYGPAQLMMAFTDDGQVCDDLVWERDARYGIDSRARAQNRQSYIGQLPPPARGADTWMSGRAPQFVTDWFKVKVPWRHGDDDGGGGSSGRKNDDDGKRSGWRGDVGGEGRFEDRDSQDGRGGRDPSDRNNKARS